MNLRMTRIIAAATLAGALLATSVAAQPASASARVPQATWLLGGSALAITPSGTYQGTSSGGVDSFRGIRYAQAPVGALRWRSPRALPYRFGITAATAWGPRCAAPQDTNGPLTLNEDCLFINVQRPAGTSLLSRRPVLVWIHGGSNLTGGADQHDGALIAQSTGSIVVTMNYRLGALGFLAHPGLTAEGGESGNFGFQDQQAALRWVQGNISAFGGDPRAVTLGGESSGGLDVCGHLASPASRGLFRAAIIQSGSCASTPLATAEASGLSGAKTLGCTDAATAVACLRAQPVSALLPLFPTSSPPPLVRGTRTFPVGPRTAIATGQFTRVPMLVGGNLDDGRTFTADLAGWTRQQYESSVNLLIGPGAGAQVLARYPWPVASDQFTAAYLIGAILTDSDKFVGVGACLDHRLITDLAKGTTVYGYEFAHRTGPGLRQTPAGYVWGAGHAAELPYLWPSFDNGTPIAPLFTSAEKQLSQNMVGAWGRFVAGSTPAAAGLPAWPSVNRSGQFMSLDAGTGSRVISETTFMANHQCDFWDPQNTDLS